MRELTKQFLKVVLVLLIAVALFGVFSQATPNVQPLAIGDLATRINDGQVKAIEVIDSELKVTLNDATTYESRKEGEASLVQTLIGLGVSPESLRKVEITVSTNTEGFFWTSTILSTIVPILVIGALLWFMLRQAQRGQMQAMSFGQARPRMFSPDDKNRLMFKDVAGMKEAKEELEEVVDFLRQPAKYIAIGAKIPRGVLLMGAPGTGKTLLARAVAGEAKAPFFHISGSEFVEMFVGVGASRVRDLFKIAKKHAPSIVFIDEIDAVGRQRGAGLGGGHDEREQTLNQILVEMDGFEKDTNVIVMAATNRPDVLDPALLRPGRFDRRVVVELPDIKARAEILALHAKNKPLGKDVSVREIAERTPGFSGADLENLLNEAAIFAARFGKKIITHEHITEAMDKVILGVARRSRVISDKEKKITAYHEAGHALVSHFLPNTDPVRKISIIGRGHAAGYTLTLPESDKQFYSQSEFGDELAKLMGGYAAEQITFKEVTTGASNDLKRAFLLARDVVTRYGMSPSIGPVAFDHHDEPVFLGREIAERRAVSEQTASTIDKEIQRFLKVAYERATELLNKHFDILTKVSEALISKETLERDEFNALVGSPKMTPVTA